MVHLLGFFLLLFSSLSSISDTRLPRSHACQLYIGTSFPILLSFPNLRHAVYADPRMTVPFGIFSPLAPPLLHSSAHGLRRSHVCQTHLSITHFPLFCFCCLHYHSPLHYFLPFAFSRCGMVAYHNADSQ